MEKKSASWELRSGLVYLVMALGKEPYSPLVHGDLSYFVIVNLGVVIIFHPLKEARDHMVNTNYELCQHPQVGISNLVR
jgi:hypothetical protein